ncbi:MAG: PepSY domain-containing protein [Rhizobiales bacterium]|nr:PepSY domain-containing protein [Hyphomicrobiales bacterium]
MSRKILTAFVLSIAMTGAMTAGALAQAAAPGSTGSTAPSAPPAVNAAPLENGANSFTEAQARARLEQAGLTGVGELKKDDQGIWRGRAMRNGATVAVGVDFRGNVSAQ